MYKKLVAAVCAVVLMALGVGIAFAGEVKGPPGSVTDPNTNYNTNATDNANSACVFSGLNDFGGGQTTRPTQTPADGPPGAPGHGAEGFPDGCKGGSNPDNQP
jgi:hypothetical protein